MGKLFAALIAASFLLGAAPVSADVLSDVKSRGKLVCGVLGNFEPYGFMNQTTHQLKGYEVDYCHELANHIGVPAEMKVVTTQGRVAELLQGRVDVLAALISYTPERAKQVLYSGIYHFTQNQFMVLSETGFDAASDLLDKRIAVSKGSALERFLRENYTYATVVSFDDKTASYLALKTKKVDALLTGIDTLASLQNRDPEPGKTRIIEEPIYPFSCSFAVRLGETGAQSAINEFLQQAERSGLAQRIFDKWFGPETVYKLKKKFVVGDVPYGSK